MSDATEEYLDALDALALQVVAAIGTHGTLQDLPPVVDAQIERSAIRLGLAARNRWRREAPAGGCQVDPSEDWCPWCVPPAACSDAAARPRRADR